MKRRKLSIVIAVSILILSTLACNIGKQAPPAETKPQGENPTKSAPPEQASNSSSGECTNPYYPVVTGATWNYNLTGTYPDTFVRSIVSVDAGSFTDQDVFGRGVTRQGQWNCDNGALIALDPTSGNSASVSSDKVSVDFSTTSASGVTLPAALNPGDTWTQAVTLEGTETINGAQIPAKNEFLNSCTVAGSESVTVAAGTFDAIRVDCQTSMKITITMNDNPVETPVDITATSWYAENVGMVKEVTTGDSVNSTIELTSFSIP